MRIVVLTYGVNIPTRLPQHSKLWLSEWRIRLAEGSFRIRGHSPRFANPEAHYRHLYEQTRSNPWHGSASTGHVNAKWDADSLWTRPSAVGNRLCRGTVARGGFWSTARGLRD